MKSYKIVVKDLPIIRAKNKQNAYYNAIDIVNDIGHDGNYDLVEVKK